MVRAKFTPNVGNELADRFRIASTSRKLVEIATLCCVVALGITHPSARARELSNLRFDRIAVSEQFSSIAVTSIAQDGFGFIWIGTRDGLNRFDGYELTEFRNSHGESDGLPHNYIERIYVDKRGEVWVGTRRGTCRYDVANDQIVSYLPGGEDHAVTGFAETRQGELLLCSEGGDLFRFDRENDIFESLTNQELGTLKSVLVDRSGRIWAGSEGYLYLLNSDFNVIREWEFTDELDRDAFVFVGVMAEDPDGRIWLGTNRVGLWSIEPETMSLSKYDGPNLPGFSVGSILFPASGEAFFGGNEGLVAIDLDSGRSHKYTNKEYELTSLQAGTVHALMEDRQSNLWVGTSRGGLSAIKNGKAFRTRSHSPYDSNSLSKNKATSVFVDSQKRLWVGYHNDGIDMLDMETLGKRYFGPENGQEDGLGVGSVWDIVEDQRGQIWIGSSFIGLQQLDPATGVARKFLPDENDPNSIRSTDVRNVLMDRRGNLWLGFHGQGLGYLDLATNEFKHYSDLTRLWIEDLALDDSGDLWIASSEGVSHLREGGNEFVDYGHDSNDYRSLSDKHVVCLLVDSQQNVWAGSINGLNRLNRSEGVFERIGTEDQLPSFSIRSLAEDGRGRIWIATSKGLAVYDPQTEQFESYDRGDGLLSNEFVYRSVFATDDGELIFGTEKGYVRFHPDDIKRNETAPSVVLTAFQASNEEVSVHDYTGILHESLLTVDEIVLPPGMNSFSFEFAALDYISPEKNQYAYQLDGFDEDWTYVGTRRNCYYTNIFPGEYVFRVKGSNNDGVWNEEGASVRIIVVPWFWQTLWFAGVCLIAIAGVVVFVFRMRVANIRKQKGELRRKVNEQVGELREALSVLESHKARITEQNKELEEHRENLEELIQERTKELLDAKIKAEESDRLKSAFLANMSHEIRTPMNAIMGFLQLMKEDSLEKDELNEYREIIQKNGESLLLLIDDILDLSRLEAGVVKVQNSFCLVNELMEDLYRCFICDLESNEKKKTRLTYERNSELLDLGIQIDQQRLRQTLSNLLENAIKFTDDGDVTFGYRLNRGEQSGERIEFYIHDTGIGISKDKISQIFECFGKIEEKSGKLYRGAGLGLSIASRLTELMGGSISVESEFGNGASFVVSFPPVIVDVEEMISDAENEILSTKTRMENVLENLKEFEPIKVLVAEDEDPNFQYIETVLSRIGCRISRVSDGTDVVGSIESVPPDVILMDIKMPIMDGLSATREIRRMGESVPVIAQTAFSLPEDRQASFDAGANLFLSKPFTSLQLLETILKALQLEREGVETRS